MLTHTPGGTSVHGWALEGARFRREAYQTVAKWLAVVSFVTSFNKKKINILQKSYIKICIYNFFVVSLQCEIKTKINQLKTK